MTRDKQHPRLVGRKHFRPRSPRKLQDDLYRYKNPKLRRNYNYIGGASISPRGSFDSIKGNEAPRLWQRSSSPAPRQLGDTSFRYHGLDQRSKEMRLVRILPETTSIIKCELLNTSLYNPCRYIALSYAWGDAADTGNIMLDGHDFPVTESLMLALGRLRSRYVPVIVWVDAICINQGDIEERNLQVQVMTSIYKKADEVAIWLGPEADGSDVALELLRNFYQVRDSPAQIRAIIASPYSTPSFQALVALFDRDYWGRLWVVQEVINGNNITVYCGANSLPWHMCLIASDVLLKYYQYLLIAFRYVGGIAAISASGRTCPGQLACGGPAGLRDLREDGGPDGLLEVLLFHQEKSCMEPRDRIYGLLGILSPSESSQFPVDYSRSVKDVYIDVVDYLLTTTRSLDVICASMNFPAHQTIYGLPSWCPDWSQRRRLLPIWHRFRGFSASGTSHPKISFLKKRRTLKVSAILLDKVTSCGVPLHPPICRTALLMAFFEWRQKLIKVKAYNQPDHEAFCRTLSCGQLPDTWTPHEWLESTYRTFARGLLGRLSDQMLDPHLMFYAQNFIPLSLTGQEQELYESFANAMTGRCFAITNSGLLCLGSGALQVEDIICVPLGCSTPIILRKRGGGYTFIGDAYVDGYMYGKAINDWRYGLRELKEFQIE